MKYKIFIPSAGLGTRLEQYSKNYNKALVSIANKPVISHVIEKFPTDIEIVVALGHKGNLIRDYLDLAYGDERSISYVTINPYHGSGSGLGTTILQCRNLLQCPFVFCTNDTIVLEDIPIPNKNWIGYTNVDKPQHYRTLNLKHKNNILTLLSLNEKNTSISSNAYIGLSGIYNFEEFWYFMEEGINGGSIAGGESYALNHMVLSDILIEPLSFTWFDTGDKTQLEHTRAYFKAHSEDKIEILEKNNEDIWFVNNKVIKFSKDETFIKERIERSKIIQNYIPKILYFNTNMYAYTMVRGNVLSKVVNLSIFDDFLNWMCDFWKENSFDSQFKITTKEFTSVCLNFYKDKTYDRIQQFFNKTSQYDEIEIINGIRIPKIYDLLKTINWKWLSEGIPVNYHGDLHFENIIIGENGCFYLIDWRQNFGGLSLYGDIYYDLAKLNHGLIVNHELINKNHFSIIKDNDIINFDIQNKYSLIECRKKLYDFAELNQFDTLKIDILTSLIFLNIAALHHSPYDQFLYYLGKYELYKNITTSAGLTLKKIL